MGFLEKLKQIFNIDIKNFKGSLFQINIYNNSNNSTVTNIPNKPNKGGHFIDEDKGVFYLDTASINASQRKFLKDSSKEYVEKGNRLLEYKTSNLFEELYNFKRHKSGSAVIDFFSKIIPEKDLETLEASLFLRSKFQNGENISSLKKDIINRFGERGSNISNLCTAGYFEMFLIPLYNASPESFPKMYEDIVNNSMMALFVNRKTKASDIPIEIEKNIKLSKKYGIKQFHIHGIGEANIKKIKKCIEAQKAFFNFFEKNIYENKTGDIIIVELILAK